MLKNAFRPVGEAALAFDFKKCCTAKEQRFRYLNGNHFRTYSYLVFSESRENLYCKYCAIFSTSLVNCGVGKNRQKPGKLVIELQKVDRFRWNMNKIGWNITNLRKVMIYLLTSCNTEERIAQNILSSVLQEVKRLIITFLKFIIYPLTMIALWNITNQFNDYIEVKW